MIVSEGELGKTGLAIRCDTRRKGKSHHTNLKGSQVGSLQRLRPQRVTRSDPKLFTLRHLIDTVPARPAIDQAAKLAEGTAAQVDQEAGHQGKSEGSYRPFGFHIRHNSYRAGHRIAQRAPTLVKGASTSGSKLKRARYAKNREQIVVRSRITFRENCM